MAGVGPICLLCGRKRARCRVCGQCMWCFKATDACRVVSE